MWEKFGPLTKQQFILNAEPYLLAQQLPREYTLQIRMGAYKWHLSAVRMTDLEVRMHDLAQGIRELENLSNGSSTCN